MGQIVTKRRLAWIALAVLGVLAVIATLWSAFGPDQIVLTTAQLQERVNRALPREFKGVTVDQATVSIADGRIALRVTAHAAALGQSVKAAASARRVPRYIPIAARFSSTPTMSKSRISRWPAAALRNASSDWARCGGERRRRPRRDRRRSESLSGGAAGLPFKTTSRASSSGRPFQTSRQTPIRWS